MFVFHFRHDYDWIGKTSVTSKLLQDIFKRRAVTVVVLVFGGSAYIGEATCSWQDQFNRKIGYRMALGRAKRDAGRMYDAMGYHGSDCKYPYAPMDDGITMKTKVQWALKIAKETDRAYGFDQRETEQL